MCPTVAFECFSYLPVSMRGCVGWCCRLCCCCGGRMTGTAVSECVVMGRRNKWKITKGVHNVLCTYKKKKENNK